MKAPSFLRLILFFSIQQIISSFFLSYPNYQKLATTTPHGHVHKYKNVYSSSHQSFQIKPSETKTKIYRSIDSSTDTDNSIISSEEIIEYASNEEVIISLSTFGPGYRAIARPKHNTTQILGYCSGFIRPGGKILHLDEMRVFKKALQIAREENPKFVGGGTVFGVGLLLGCLCFRYGIDNGCEIGEFLAIDDGVTQHTRLVRHYKRLGLKVIRYVGEDISNIPDRLIWGGCGTLMNNNLKETLRKYNYVFSRPKKD